MPNKKEVKSSPLTHVEAIAEAGSYLDPDFKKYVLPDGSSQIKNIYRYRACTRLVRPELCNIQTSDTIIYRIVHDNDDLFILILHPEPRSWIEKEMYPNLALCVVTNSENVIVVSPATGTIREYIGLRASNPQGRPISTPLLGIDTRLTITEVILNEQLNQEKFLPQNFPFGNEAK